MATENVSAIIRKILEPDLSLPGEEVLRQARARGVTGDKKTIQKRIVNVRSLLKKAAGGSPTATTHNPTTPNPAAPNPAAPNPTTPNPTAPKSAPKSPAHKSPAPKATAPKSPSVKSAAKPAAAPDSLDSVFSNVALVNAIITACGGVESTRSAAEAVRSCGGVDQFIRHLELIVELRTGAK